MMGLNPYSLVHTIFLLFLCVFNILLVVLGAWVLEFLYQQWLSPNLIFLCLLCSYE